MQLIDEFQDQVPDSTSFQINGLLANLSSIKDHSNLIPSASDKKKFLGKLHTETLSR